MHVCSAMLADGGGTPKHVAHVALERAPPHLYTSFAMRMHAPVTMWIYELQHSCNALMQEPAELMADANSLKMEVSKSSCYW